MPISLHALAEGSVSFRRSSPSAPGDLHRQAATTKFSLLPSAFSQGTSLTEDGATPQTFPREGELHQPLISRTGLVRKAAAALLG
ncbi:hypothetical protein ECG_01914 [Echinococcus granulosus]|nr:hypothetical protein ECG_01914 [Echinococcus granulosus]